MMLEGEDSTFKHLAGLLELFSEFGEGTGTMFVIAAPCSEPQQSLVPAIVNGKPDLLREQDDPGNGCVLLCASTFAQGIPVVMSLLVGTAMLRCFI